MLIRVERVIKRHKLNIKLKFNVRLIRVERVIERNKLNMKLNVMLITCIRVGSRKVKSVGPRFLLI